MSQSIILSFFKNSDLSEHELEISELDLKVLELHEIVESIRYKSSKFRSYYVVPRFSIAFDNKLEIFESLDLKNATLEGISLVEDGNVIRTLAVKQDRNYSVAIEGELIVLTQR